MPEANLYAAPAQPDEPIPANANAELEAIRRKHLSREANVQSIGSLLQFGGVLLLLGGLTALVPVLDKPKTPLDFLLSTGLFAIGAVDVFAGSKLRALQPIGRLLYTITTGLLIAFQALRGNPVGMIVPLVFVAFLWTGPSKMVFSAYYRDTVLPATPHLKYRTPKWVIVLLIALLAVLIGAMVYAVRASGR